MKLKIWISLAIAALLLSACGAKATPTPLPTVVLQDNTSALDQSTPGMSSNSSGATASGLLVSDHQSQLAFVSSGNVKSVNAAIGQAVKAGHVLATLDDSILQAQLDEANLALANFTSPLGLSNAQQAVADDNAALDSAEGTYYWWLDLQKQSQDLLSKANADMIVAESDLKDAQDDYNKYTEAPNDQKDKAIAYQKMYAVQQRINDIQTRINLYSKADPLQMAKYKAAIDVAKAKLADDQAVLAALNGGELPQTSTGSSYAQLAQAKLNVQIAEANLKNSQLIAPFDGTVASVDLAIGDFAPAGKIEMSVIDPLHLHAETTDLSERDVTNVKLGQAVTVTIKPLNQQAKGKVTAISPQADTLGGDVVYKAIIQLESLPDGALPGMSVTVDFLSQ